MDGMGMCTILLLMVSRHQGWNCLMFFCFHLDFFWMFWVYQQDGDDENTFFLCQCIQNHHIMTSTVHNTKNYHSKMPWMLQWWGLNPGSLDTMADCVVLQGRRKSNHLQAWLMAKLRLISIDKIQVYIRYTHRRIIWINCEFSII